MEEIKKITGEIKIAKGALFEIEKEVKNISQFKNKIQEYLESPVTELSEIIFAGAINLEASDIHIEPEEERAKLRIRIDGILQDVLFFELKIFQTLVSRIKLLSGIKLNVFDRPQDGRFSILLHANSARSPSFLAESEGSRNANAPMRITEEDLAIEIRASTLPAEYGESIVLRILNPKSLIELETLGLRKEFLEIAEKETMRPNGMIVVTGPTGCGKTTTLYAFLKKIRRPEIKIITIEDPIEYHLEGVSQTQVDPLKGYDFASGLKSVMRQDPDVILVGEIRDLETVDIATQAALTGHLVLTTLHTNDAYGAIARLTSLGAKISNIAPALNVVIAQRLVRKVCNQCRKLTNPSEEELKKLKRELAPLKIKIKKDVKIPRIQGCNDCNKTGYRERIGIFEVFSVDDEMEGFILKKPSIIDLKRLAIKKGMTTMKQDGFIKVLEGITTIEEVERVMGE